MPAITHGSRLDRLRALRERVDSEIRSIEKARARLMCAPGEASADLVRLWARERGIQVAHTGKLSNRVREQYAAAHRAKTP